MDEGECGGAMTTNLKNVCQNISFFIIIIIRVFLFLSYFYAGIFSSLKCYYFFFQRFFPLSLSFQRSEGKASLFIIIFFVLCLITE